jgi:hypothetical protein
VTRAVRSSRLLLIPLHPAASVPVHSLSGSAPVPAAALRVYEEE